MTNVDMIETRREWTDRLCRPVRVTNDAYGNDSEPFDSLEQAEAVIAACICDCQSLLPEDGLQEGEDFEFVVLLMEPAKGTVASREEWEADFADMDEEEWGGPDFESAGLVEVEPDGQGGWQEV